MTTVGATNYVGLAAQVPGAGVGRPLGYLTHRFAVQIAYPANNAALLGSFVLGTNVLAEVVWRDVTNDAMSTAWERGATNGQRPMAGQLDLTLLNTTRTYSPGQSNYFGPGTLVRVVCGDPTLITSVQFTGVTQTWTESFTDAQRFVNITALEPMFMLGSVNNLATPPRGAGENLTARVNRIVDAAQFPFAVETNWGGALAGTQTFQATSLAQEALSELYLTVDSVDGQLFPTKAGKLGVVERSALYRSTSYVVGSNVNIMLDTLAMANDDLLLVSEVTLARAGGTELTYTNQAVVGRHFSSSGGRSDLITQSDADLATVAGGLLARGTQTLRPVSVQVMSDVAASYDFLEQVDLFSTMNVVDAAAGVTFTGYAVCRLSHSVVPQGANAQLWNAVVEFAPTGVGTGYTPPTPPPTPAGVGYLTSDDGSFYLDSDDGLYRLTLV